MSTHYRSPIEFSQERLQEAGVAYQRLRTPLERASAWDAPDGNKPGGALGERVAEADRLFHEAMDDDFNSAQALGHLFDLARDVNRALDEGAGAEGRAAARELLRLGGILGLFWRPPAEESWDSEVLALVEQRQEARKSKDWKAADAIRDKLAALGLVVEDTAQGPKIKRKG
jgi:cysteinyl-tRNA synthetase